MMYFTTRKAFSLLRRNVLNSHKTRLVAIPPPPHIFERK